jgi:hypothetical protein
LESWGAGLLDDLGSLQVDSIVKRDERLADVQKTVETLRKSVTDTATGSAASPLPEGF